MAKKQIIFFLIGITIITTCFLIPNKKESQKELEKNELNATVMAITEDKLIVEDQTNIIYTFNKENITANIGDYLSIEYTGLLDKNKSIQNCSITNYKEINSDITSTGIPTEWIDEGIFKNYYELAYQKLQTLSLNEKIGELFLVRYDETKAIEDIKNLHIGGFVFYEKDFKNKTKEDVQKMISNLQNSSKIPLLTSVDEEGGKIIRISSNPNLIETLFKSSKDLYNEGGFEKIKEDTINKSNLLNNLGINVNLAPVVDVSTNESDYMYERALGLGTRETSKYAKTVIEASKGTNVSYTLKHFPGYGNNVDTHTNRSTDNRTYESILNNDIPPFEAGIASGAEAVLMSHNIVTSIDENNPTSLSPSIHNLLRNRLEFTGIIITDDLSMGATKDIPNASVKALLAGNDLIISTNYLTDINDIKNAVNNNTISEELIDRVALRVLAWKYYKGLITNEK